ncbi:Ig-like domain-containing protein [Paenibacillus sp. Marseille-Q4541]|uniref:Ig-like domain-containing protein n=1 Tax=Paenibacillus sp. Marseille-Q4541 TaxID=2831522 RepID=UPI001BABFB1C|nr:Ig-like domain-containing protein [Paenibacillus sp. Marseille-Q4541]
MTSLSRKCGLLCLAFVLVAMLVPSPSAKAADRVTLDSHQDGQIVSPGIEELHGTYTNVFDVEIVVNGQWVADVHMNDPDADNSGTWTYPLDTTKLDGPVEIALKSKDKETRYGIWSSFIHLVVNNPDASSPEVFIVDPAESGAVLPNENGIVPIHISAEGKNAISQVELRINGGPWEPLQLDEEDGKYTYSWNTTQLTEERKYSLEARATDQNGNTGYSLTTYLSLGQTTVTNSVYEENTPLPYQDRAIWIWETASYHLVLNPNSWDTFAAFTSDTTTFSEHPITTLYLGVDKYNGASMLEDYRDEVQQFVTWAHNNGYQVQALIAGGTTPPYYGTYERYRTQAIREFEKVLNYNLASESSAQFDGINLDTEPYILPDFKTDKPSVQIQYLDMLAALMERKTAAGIGFPVGAAIPRWYDSSADASAIPWKGSTKWLSEHIQDTADYISIMDYRDQAEGSAGIIQHALGELAYAASIGKPNSVIIGVETKDIADGGDPETISFHEEGRAYMEEELNKVYAAFQDNTSFGGIALHHYTSLIDFPSKWGPGGVKWSPPADLDPPSLVSGPPSATAFDHERIDLSYGMSQDNTAVNEYRIYRSTDADFTTGPLTYAGTAKGLSYEDRGLLADTTYYYKITAVDLQGNESVPSEAVSATTSASTLKPMVVDQMLFQYTGGKASVTLRVVDLDTGAPVSATISGRFTQMAGKYVTAKTTASGIFQASSEAVSTPSGEIGFLPRRIMAPGYYWASSYDQLPYETIVWEP